jgi:hypothetical protein
MKKAVSLLLILALVVVSAGLIACGGKEEGGATQTQTQSPTATQTTSPAGGGLTWSDMPVYSGASQLQSATWQIPAAEGEWTKMEWRYYETSASVSAVAAFYRSQMPNKGWQEQGWFEAQGVSWGFWMKNDEHDGAYIWIGLGEDKTDLALMRASK